MLEPDITVVVSPEIAIATVVSEPDIAISLADEGIDVAVNPPDEIQASVSQEVVQVVTLQTGEPGPKGDKGDQGERGLKGDGFAIDAQGSLSGRDAYDNELEGFSYLDTENSLLYFRQTEVPGTWSTGVVFGKGDKGDPGKSILSGTADPTAEIGLDGDFYLNTTSSMLFGPKATTWPAGTSLIGETGAPGTAVLHGPVDPTDSVGIDGDFYINTVTIIMFGPKQFGSWATPPVSLKGEKGDQGDSFTINATGLITERGLYENTFVNFVFYATDELKVYILQALPSTWSVGIPFGVGEQGPPGPQGPIGPAGEYTGPVIYAQPSEPAGAPQGAIWIKTT